MAVTYSVIIVKFRQRSIEVILEYYLQQIHYVIYVAKVSQQIIKIKQE
jgi:hypothetical protein